MKKKYAGRILLTIIGAALILWGFGALALGLWGERGTAVITSIRRQGGERDDVMPGRYTYQIGYSFTTVDSIQAYGAFTAIQSAAYQKANGMAPLFVRYIPAIPQINAPEKDTRLSLRQPVLIGAGVFLVTVVNRKKHKRRV